MKAHFSVYVAYVYRSGATRGSANDPSVFIFGCTTPLSEMLTFHFSLNAFRHRLEFAFAILRTASDRNICALRHETSVLSALWLTPRNRARFSASDADFHFSVCRGTRLDVELRAGAGALWRSRHRAYACNRTSSRGAIQAHRGVCDGRDVYFFKSSYREAVNKARDLGRSDRGFPLLLKLDPIPLIRFLSLSLSVPIRSPKGIRSGIYLPLRWMEGRWSQARIFRISLASFWAERVTVWWDAGIKDKPNTQ